MTVGGNKDWIAIKLINCTLVQGNTLGRCKWNGSGREDSLWPSLVSKLTGWNSWAGAVLLAKSLVCSRFLTIYEQYIEGEGNQCSSPWPWMVSNIKEGRSQYLRCIWWRYGALCEVTQRGTGNVRRGVLHSLRFRGDACSIVNIGNYWLLLLLLFGSMSISNQRDRFLFCIRLVWYLIAWSIVDAFSRFSVITYNKPSQQTHHCGL